MLIVANWKTYITDIKNAVKLLSASKKLVKATGVRIVLAPPAPLLGALAIKNKSTVAFSAQDISATLGGAHTGEIPASAYATSGAKYAIIGHSERRTTGDTNDVVATKLARAIAHGLTPILCVGEHERDDEGKYLAVIREELTTAIGPLAKKDRANIIIAYEPLWAIWKDAEHAIDPSDLAEMVLYIHKVLSELLTSKNVANTLILYGGSVDPSNVRDLARGSGIGGFLVGHASADPGTFAIIVKQLA